MTATGWTFGTLNESSASDVFALLRYWADEPPAHVLLALRYLGPGKRGKKIDEAQTRRDMGEISKLANKPVQPLPPNLKDIICQAEQLKKDHGGLL